MNHLMAEQRNEHRKSGGLITGLFFDVRARKKKEIKQVNVLTRFNFFVVHLGRRAVGVLLLCKKKKANKN